MPIQIKFNNKYGLCSSCKNSFITESEKGVNIRCNYFFGDASVIINDIVTKCNQYTDSNHPSRHEFEELAWIIKTNDKNKVGFEPPPKKD